MKCSKMTLGVCLLGLLLGGISEAQGKGNGGGKGGGGGGGGGGGNNPPAPAIAFNSGGHLSVMDADGGNKTVILPYAGHPTSMEPSWSPDGMQVVFNGTISGPGIYVINVDGSGLTLVTETNADYTGPAWSPVAAPDGRFKILFVDEVVTPDGLVAEVFATNLDGTDTQQLTDDPNDLPFDVSWAPGAYRFAVCGVDFGTGQLVPDCSVFDLGVVDGTLAVTGEVSVIQLPGGPLENADSVGWVDWANGSDTLGIAVAQGGWDIWIVELSNPLNAFPSISGKAAERQPSWSPDDSRIVYWRTGPGKDGIYTVDSFGVEDPVLLTSSGTAPDWKR